MPATITRKCQQVADFIRNHQHDGYYQEKQVQQNTQVSINSDGSRSIYLWSTRIVGYNASNNEYEVKNWGWRSRTTAHDIRAYLELLLNYTLRDWDIYTDSHRKVECENYEIGYGTGRRWKFNPTAFIFRWDEDE